MKARTAALMLLSCLVAFAAEAQQTEEALNIPFGERVDVEVVSVDVIVTDAQGHRVADLDRGDFELRIDGAIVPVEYFSPPRAAGPKPVAAEPATTIAVPRPAIAAEPESLVIVFVDQSALDVRASKRIIDGIRKFVLPRMDGSTAVLVAAFVEQLRILAPRTIDRHAVEAALVELEELRGRGSLIGAERKRIENEIRGFGNVPIRGDPERMTQYIRNERQRLESDVHAWGERSIDRQRRSVAALRQWVNAIAGIEGRKSMLLASDGITPNSWIALQRLIDVMIRSASNIASPVKEQFSSTDDFFVAGSELVTEFESMVRAAQNARVAFYTISPRTPPVLESTAELGKIGGESAPAAPRDEAPVEAASSLVHMGASTGGGNLYLDDDLARNLERVVEDDSAAYSLGFTTGEGAGKADHEIEVRALCKGCETRHRETFRRRSLQDRAEQALAAASSLRTSANPLGITIELGEVKPPAKGSEGAVVPLLVSIPLRGLALVPDGGRLLGQLQARVAILDARHEQRFGAASPIAVAVAAADEPRIATHNWAYRAEMRLAPGKNLVAVVVVDEISGVVATAAQEIEVPARGAKR